MQGADAAASDTGAQEELILPVDGRREYSYEMDGKIGEVATMADNPSSLEFVPRGFGSVLGFPAHDGRSSAIGEVHSRPHPLIESPRVLIQLAFMTEGGLGVDHAVLAELSRRLGIAAPDRQARHHAMKWGKGTLRWERHTEFSSYLWEGPLAGATGPAGRFAVRQWLRPARHRDLRDKAGNPRMDAGQRKAGRRRLRPESLCYSLVENGRAAIVTDFRQDGDGLTRILMLDRGLSLARAARCAQRLIDIETYRTLAMLGLPMAQSLSPAYAASRTGWRRSPAR